jgi:hypothetical protein
MTVFVLNRKKKIKYFLKRLKIILWKTKITGVPWFVFSPGQGLSPAGSAGAVDCRETF